ncbi:hypothetical protein BaRGS_00037780 [Batillaria attramentaria]|uniref:Uncharacterized protein n=1 Tax=Batillaria attramentaria TaxID=370345 RepID=A0ABD0J852_9CAEN
MLLDKVERQVDLNAYSTRTYSSDVHTECIECLALFGDDASMAGKGVARSTREGETGGIVASSPSEDKSNE